MRINTTVLAFIGFDLLSTINGTCFICGYTFVNCHMPKSWDKLKRRYDERMSDG